jgi:hypothetical protein
VFCKHEWNKITETTTESKAEQLNKMGVYGFPIWSEWLVKKYICILQCKKCGKLSKTIKKI